ncbi:hypothetical protein EV643_104121 [Kribbella sp. VKM Ac-2527]|uniref:Uncharacterized protein n=1 Tax=Kribbella caucasensis TaxID=2512215 RepID=A0A4V3CAI8_9ACTN|nr:hypothetical protein [Kribbella sp. VKM Ac-2527]TDO50628.1 hypothetical protein EV643_104121 [Kribbella sp. VKM Ac-2527]
MEDLQKCEFPTVTGLLETVRSVNASIEIAKNDWLTKMNISSMEMLDGAGGAFTEVYNALNRVTEASGEMQRALAGAGMQAVDANMATVNRCAAGYGTGM